MAVSTRELQLMIKVSGKIGALTQFVRQVSKLEKGISKQTNEVKKAEKSWAKWDRRLRSFNKTLKSTLGALGGKIPILGALGGIAGTFLRAFTGIVGKVAGIFKKIVSTAVKILGGIVRAAMGIAKAVARVFMGMASLVGKALGGLVSIVSGVFGRIVGIAKKAAIAMGVAIVGFTIYAIKKMADFELKMREVWTLLPKVSKAGYDEMYNQVLEMSSRIPKKAEDLAAGLYKVVSSGFKRGAEAMQIMNKGAELAVAGITDVQFALDPLISLLHAYGKGAESSGKAGDVLMKTLELARMNFMELADGMGMVSGTAAAMNVTWEHLGASIALASRVLKPDVTFVAVNRAMMAMMAPAKGAAKAFKQYGFQVQFNEKGNMDMLKTIEKMREAMAGLPIMEVSKRMKAMFPNIRALRFWFAVLGQGADRVNEVFGLMGEHAGALQMAFKKVLTSISSQFRLFLNNVTRVGIELFTAFGPDIASNLTKINKKLESVANTIRAWRDAGYFADLQTQFWNFVADVQRTPAFEWLAKQLKNLTTKAPSWFAEMAKSLWESFRSAFELILGFDWDAFRAHAEYAFRAIAIAALSIGQSILASIEGALPGIEVAINTIIAKFRPLISLLSLFGEGPEEKAKRLTGKAKELRERAFRAKREAEIAGPGVKMGRVDPRTKKILPGGELLSDIAKKRQKEYEEAQAAAIRAQEVAEIATGDFSVDLTGATKKLAEFGNALAGQAATLQATNLEMAAGGRGAIFSREAGAARIGKMAAPFRAAEPTYQQRRGQEAAAYWRRPEAQGMQMAGAAGQYGGGGAALAASGIGGAESERQQMLLRELNKLDKEEKANEEFKQGTDGLTASSGKLDKGASKLDKAADKLAVPKTKAEEKQEKASEKFEKAVEKQWKRLREGKPMAWTSMQQKRAGMEAVRRDRLEKQRTEKAAEAKKQEEAGIEVERQKQVDKEVKRIKQLPEKKQRQEVRALKGTGLKGDVEKKLREERRQERRVAASPEARAEKKRAEKEKERQRIFGIAEPIAKLPPKQQAEKLAELEEKTRAKVRAKITEMPTPEERARAGETLGPLDVPPTGAYKEFPTLPGQDELMGVEREGQAKAQAGVQQIVAAITGGAPPEGAPPGAPGAAPTGIPGVAPAAAGEPSVSPVAAGGAADPAFQKLSGRKKLKLIAKERKRMQQGRDVGAGAGAVGARATLEERGRQQQTEKREGTGTPIGAKINGAGAKADQIAGLAKQAPQIAGLSKQVDKLSMKLDGAIAAFGGAGGGSDAPSQPSGV